MKLIIRIIIIVTHFSTASSLLPNNHETQQRIKQILNLDQSTPTLAVEWHPTENYLAVSDEHTVTIWDIESQAVTHIFDTDTALVTSMSWNIDGRRLAALGTYVVVWDVISGNNLEILKFPENVANSGTVDWSPDGLMLAYSQWQVDLNTSASWSIIQIWDEDSRKIGSIGNQLSSLLHAARWSQDGSMLAIADGDVISIWDRGTRELIVETNEVRNVAAVAWSPNGDLLTYGNTLFLGMDDEGTPRFQPTIEIWDVASSQNAAQIETEIERIDVIVWSPDGTLFATNGQNGTIMIWELATREVIATLRGHENGVTSLDWNPNGNLLASSGYDETVRIWDVSSLTRNS